VPAVGKDVSPIAGVPDLYGMIVSAGNYTLPIGRPGDAPDRTGMSSVDESLPLGWRYLCEVAIGEQTCASRTDDSPTYGTNEHGAA
jgi:hypothetical protein